MNPLRLIIGISGSSAPILGIRLLEVLREIPGVQTHLVLSSTVSKTLEAEAPNYSLDQVRGLADHWYAPQDIAAAIASGSFKTEGMVIAPCSMRTLGAVAHGMGDNLMTRAADVSLKERRKLIWLLGTHK